MKKKQILSISEMNAELVGMLNAAEVSIEATKRSIIAVTNEDQTGQKREVREILLADLLIDDSTPRFLEAMGEKRYLSNLPIWLSRVDGIAKADGVSIEAASYIRIMKILVLEYLATVLPPGSSDASMRAGWSKTRAAVLRLIAGLNSE